MSAYELNTSIANLRDLRQSDLSDYDAVYLGDIYCRIYEANFLEHADDLKEGVRIVHDQGKRAYVTTYAAPRNDYLARIRAPGSGYMSTPFAEDVELSMRLG